jgi:GAF domain-containing protein/serine phosphatase RsbU (regulator of sigma subunit)/anti-sigma regulatory factor (Ser/Thr protein kinase)
MAPNRRDIPWQGYALGVAGPLVVSAILPRGEGTNLVVPALCYLLTVVGAAAVGRIGPGLVAAAVSTIGLLYLFVQPGRELAAETTTEVFAVGVFAVTALVVSGVLDRLEAARESSERAVERLTRLQAITAALSQALDEARVTDVVVGQACRELGGERGTLSVLDAAGRELTLVAAFGLEPETVRQWHTYPVDAQLPASEAARTGQLVLLESVSERNRRYPAIAAVPPYQDHALACVPLLFEDRVFGVISLSFGHPRSFPPEDRSFLEALGSQCAQALERARLYEAERDAAKRQAFLSEASKLLNSSLDYEDTLARISRLAVPALADTASVHLWDGDDLRLVGLAHADDRGEEVMRALSARDGDVAVDPTMREVASTGRSVLSPEIPPEMWEAIAEDAEHRALLEELGTRAALLVPLGVRVRPLGLLSLGMTTSGRTFTEDDLVMIEDLAGRAGVAIENAAAHRARVEQARVLQQSLLPPGPPVIPGLDVAVHYRAAGDGSIVGGDFFDMFALRGGGGGAGAGADAVAEGSRWGVVLGDVSGKGVEAASLTALARYTVRAVAMTEDSPAAVLRMCNRAVLEADVGESFCTMVYAVMEVGLSGEGAVLRVASGGHPLPLRRGAGGVIESVGRAGTAIGLFPDPDVADETVVMAPGDTLVLFTDGLVEARTPAGDFAPQLLEQTLRASAGGDARTTVGAITAAVGALEEGRARDDMAVVVIGVPAEADLRRVVITGVPAMVAIRSDEHVGELVREVELVRLGGREGVVRSDYPQRLLAIIEDLILRFEAARGMIRDQAELAVAKGEATFTVEVELPAAAAVAIGEFSNVISEVERFSESGHLLTVPRSPEVRAFQAWVLHETTRQLQGQSGKAWSPGAGAGVVADSSASRVDAGEVPVGPLPAPDGSTGSEIVLPPELSSASEARRFLTETVGSWGLHPDAAHDAALVLTELVTNAVLHTRSPVRLVARRLPGTLRVEVHDGSHVLPTRRSHDVEASTGRGLELVDSVSSRWGVHATDAGKAVWFEVRA